MNKQEFLNTLKEQLEGTMDPAMISDHLRYYDQYITNQMRLGKTEEEVMEALGSPVFIAKTLEDVAEHGSTQYYQKEADGYSGAYEQDYGQSYTNAYEDVDVEEDQSIKGRVLRFLMKPKVLNILVPILLVIVLFLAFLILGAVASVALRFLVPILLIIFVVSLFRNSGN